MDGGDPLSTPERGPRRAARAAVLACAFALTSHTPRGPSVRAPVEDERGSDRKPHPLTPARERIDEQHRLFDAVEAAVTARDLGRARRLLQEHGARFAADLNWSDQREGWTIIADCLDRPGPGTAARARRFLDEQGGSALRRRVRRSCPALPGTK